ncbi:RNA 2',3'-cyclic phosphodiesterase [Candidatus Sumerlaeota bacterium]|nr:RNA 2',3'-cyclic phosphodiesterase [Candidatus Sumerlaeota bacterium]
MSDEPAPKIRTFLAVDLTEDLRAKIADLLGRLKKGVQFTGAHPKWVDPAGIHLTLKFFGQTDETQRAAIAETLRGVARRHARHTVHIKGLGVFPTPRRPRVLWVGVSKATRLCALQEDLEGALESVGWASEEREFTPHLTLARLKGLRRVHAFMDIVSGHRAWDVGPWPIDEMVLYQSTLRPQGAIYTPLERFRLSG